MRNLLLLLLLANILYFVWGMFTDDTDESGIVIVEEADLGPPLNVSTSHDADVAASVGAVLGSGEPSDLEALIGRSCVTIGPFRASADANEARSQFSAEGMRTALRPAIGQVFVGHWVQIRDIADRPTAANMINKLHGGGLTDAYLESGNDDDMYISLGLFGDMDRAEKVELQAKSLGLPAAITPQTRERQIYFVDIGLLPGRGAGAMIQKYGEEKVLLRSAATCPES